MLKKLLLSAVLAIGTTASANAALVYATEVVSAVQPAGVAATRAIGAKALGATDGEFYSLGLGGSITLKFGELVHGKGLVTEVTYKVAGYREYALIETSLNGTTWAPLITSFNGLSYAGQNLFATSPFLYVRLTDVSPAGWGIRDGFDLDSIGFTPVPLPAAGLLLAGALGGLALARRRKA